MTTFHDYYICHDKQTNKWKLTKNGNKMSRITHSHPYQLIPIWVQFKYRSNHLTILDKDGDVDKIIKTLNFHGEL